MYGSYRYPTPDVYRGSFLPILKHLICIFQGQEGYVTSRSEGVGDIEIERPELARAFKTNQRDCLILVPTIRGLRIFSADWIKHTSEIMMYAFIMIHT
jgi:hypothetical protein